MYADIYKGRRVIEWSGVSVTNFILHLFSLHHNPLTVGTHVQREYDFTYLLG
jgi:hypothetical protein